MNMGSVGAVWRMPDCQFNRPHKLKKKIDIKNLFTRCNNKMNK